MGNGGVGTWGSKQIDNMVEHVVRNKQFLSEVQVDPHRTDDGDLPVEDCGKLF